MMYAFFLPRLALAFLICSTFDWLEASSINKTKTDPSGFMSVITAYLLTDGSVIHDGWERIVAFAYGYSDKAPTLEDYRLAGIKGVDAQNIERVNQAIAQKSFDGEITKKTIQTFVDGIIKEIAVKRIVDYAKGRTQNAPTLNDFRQAGIRCVSLQDLQRINTALRNENYYDVKDAFFVQQVVYDALNIPNLILDNDAFDPDWVIMMATAMGLEHHCQIHLLGILTTGRDLNRRQSIAYSSILHYYHRASIPIGLNARQTMRTYYLDATAANPPHIAYTGGLSSIDQFDSHGCLDYEPCAAMIESTGMMCTVLQNVKRKISWVIGGHMHNIANLLRETTLCDGKTLMQQKVKQVVITTGWTSRTNGDPEMNFSEGKSEITDTSEATRYFFANRPANLPVIITSIPNAPTGESRVGDIFKKPEFQNSPMAFILSVPRYGVYGDHGLSDTDALLYAVFGGKNEEGVTYAVPVETCFHINTYGAATVGAPCGKADYYLESTTSDYVPLLEAQVRKFIDFIPTRE